MSRMLYGDAIEKEVSIGAHQGKLRAELYALGAVLAEEHMEEGGWRLSIRLSHKQYQRLFPDSLQ